MSESSLDSNAVLPGSVVVGIDGSRAALGAALWAGQIAHLRHVPLVVVYAVSAAQYFGRADQTSIESVLSRHEHEQSKWLIAHAASMVRRRNPGLRVSWLIRPGSGPDVLIDLSARAGLIVVGATGRSTIRARLLGSTASAVCNRASCPVAVVHRSAEPSERHRMRNLPVVVGVDGGPSSERAVANAFEYASMLGAPLLAVHTWLANELPYGTEVSSDGDAEREEALLAECLAGWQEKFPDVTVERVCTEGNPLVELSARAAQARMVVVGSHGRGPLTSLLLGSTSRGLVHRAPCTVLVCRTRSVR